MDKEKYPSNYVEPQNLTYEEFPRDMSEPEGMKILNPKLDNIYPKIKFHEIYSNKNGKNLYIDIIIPPKNKVKKFPLIMWAQGSAFHKQNLGDHFAELTDVAKMGYVVAIVEYRWAPDDTFPAQIRDFNSATRYMLDHANKFSIDKSKYLAWGDSSGAHTAVMSALTQNDQFFSDEDITLVPIKFKGCIDYYGPTDIDKMNRVLSTQDHVSGKSLEGEFFGLKNIYDNSKEVQKANPINYIKKDIEIPPFLIMHGNKDRKVPFNQSVILYEAMKKKNKDVDFYRICDSDHGSDAFFEPEVLKITYKFISDCFKKKGY